ncbi:MAG: metal ABC transporter substrate-binding protein, partial [Lachnospiraceae bacterium]|nr:metal ABC transporter substrate-binding protein [Lachnospiraceae bacterium]
MKKNLIKKLVSLVAATTLAGSLLAGCGNNSQPADTSTQPATDTQTQTDAQTDDSVAAADTAAEVKGVITVAASQTPHSEILAEAAKILKDQGWELQVTVFDDYVQPNNVVES